MRSVLIWGIIPECAWEQNNADLVNADRPKTPTSSWENNIKMDLKKIGWGRVDWTDLVQYKDKWLYVMNALINI